MAIFFKKKIDNNTLLGIWEIKETEQGLLKKLNPGNDGKVFLNTLSHPQRRLEWLAARVLLRKLLEELDPLINSNTPLTFNTEKTGKPTLQNLNYHFSLSHSHNWAAAIVSKTTAVGVDIEKQIKDFNVELNNLNPNAVTPYQFKIEDE